MNNEQNIDNNTNKVIRKLSQEEADILIDMLKRYAENKTLNLPGMKESLLFEIVGDTREDKFNVNIDDKRINSHSDKYTLQGRIKSDNTILIRLDIGATLRHQNPSTGEIITGTHLHIYTEGYEAREAIPFDIKDTNLYEYCCTFFKKFNIIEISQMQLRLEI